MSHHGRQSDRNAVELPSRLIELRTFACFPVSQHRGFYFPPSARGRMVPLSLQRGKRIACFSSYRFHIPIFYAQEKVPHATVIPRL